MATEANGKSYFAEPVIPLTDFQLLSQGAEAKVYEGTFLGRPAVVKQRFSKKYRHAALDSKITQHRFKQEVRAILKARKLGILTPAMYFAQPEASTIIMEKLDAQTVKALLTPGKLDAEGLDGLLKEVGRVVAVLHDGDLVHGDLTTSNLLVRNTDAAVSSSGTEDKAVDLYVLERAVTSTGDASGDIFQQILNSYRQHSKNWKSVLKKFDEEMRMDAHRSLLKKKTSAKKVSLPDLGPKKRKTKKKRQAERVIKSENADPKKSANKALRAQMLLEEYGLCPISMQPMRRPVLPSSGQAYDEISLIRYCKSGNKKCPVSGAPLKVSKGGKVHHTLDFALRKFITTQATYAKVFVPSTDKDSLLRELREGHKPETAKAVVDDTYLGYLKLSELKNVLAEFSEAAQEDGVGSEADLTYKALVAECLACRKPEICALAVDYMASKDSTWKDQQVLHEALAVGQDPDCRGQVLAVLQEKVAGKVYGVGEMRKMLGFETESVPVQQFQAQIAELVVAHGNRSLPPGISDQEFVPLLNQALRMREDLDGCSSGDLSIYEVWHMTLTALKRLSGGLDEACLERLFWRENFMILQSLAVDEELLFSHLSQHQRSLRLCISTLAGNAYSARGLDLDGEMYSSEEDYFSEDAEEEAG